MEPDTQLLCSQYNCEVWKMTSGKGRDFQKEVGCRQCVQIRDTCSLRPSSEAAHKIKSSWLTEFLEGEAQQHFFRPSIWISKYILLIMLLQLSHFFFFPLSPPPCTPSLQSPPPLHTSLVHIHGKFFGFSISSTILFIRPSQDHKWHTCY